MKKIIFLLVIVNCLFFHGLAQETKQSELLNYSSQFRFILDWNSYESQSKIINFNEELDSLSVKSSIDTANLAYLYDNLATNYSILGNNILSAYYYSKLVKLMPNESSYRFDYAIELANIDLFQKSQDEFETGLKLDSTNSFYFRAYGNIYFQQNNFNKAVYYYNKSINVSGSEHNINYSIILKYVTNIFIDSANKKIEIKSALKEWPYPIIQYLNNDLSEKEIVEIIKRNDDPDKCRLKLCESLFYIGIYNLSIGKKQLGFNMLKACIDLRIPAYIEDKMAKRILFR